MFRVPKQDPKELDLYKSLTGEAALKHRLQGMLPIMDIAGHPFYVEVRLMHLRPKDNFLSKGLDLNYGGSFDEDAKQYSFYYNKRTMEEAAIPEDIKVLPKNVVLIKFPNPYALDPVMMAKLNDKDPRSYLKEFPLLMYREAEVVPLEKTELAQLVEKNKQNELAAKHATKKKTASKKKAPKGNKGMSR